MKKLLLMKTVLLLCALVAGSSNLWADSYTLTFGSKTSSPTSVGSGTESVKSTTAMTGGTSYVTDKPFTINSGNAYYGGSSDLEKASIRVGQSRKSASLSISLSTTGQVKATSIVVNCVEYNSSQASTLNVNSLGAQNVPSSEGNLTYTYTNATTINTITLEVTKPAHIKSITVNYSTSSKEEANLSFAIPSYKVAPYTVFTQAVTNPNGLTVSYESDDTDIAYVDPDTGEILTGDKYGTATITASSEETSEYDAGSATYTITTYNPDANDGSEAKPYTVTEALALINNLADNGTISSIYVKGVVSTGLTDIVNDNTKAYDGTAQYYISVDGTTSNQLMIYRGYNVNKNKFTANTDISVGDEVTLFGTLQKYVKNSRTTPEFTSYSYIAQYNNGSDPEVKSLQVAAAEYRTYVASANLIVPTGVKAFIATGETSTTLTLKSVAKIKKDSPVILNASEGYYSFEITNEAVDYGGDVNLLKISDGTTVNGVFVLAKNGDEVGFYKWAGGALSPGKVYVDAPAATAREYLAFAFDNETTAIESVVKTQKADGQYFNLAGQRVAQPQKGLYIVNGMKVVIK